VGFEEQGGKLPEEWQRAADWLDLLNLCDFLNRPHLNELMKQEIIQLVSNILES
jgi:Cys-tRNA synthase (O-phospho-L-seryl-tRNA:Cys-tRNA synthase)